MRAVVAIQDIETALLSEVGKLQLGPVLTKPSQQHEASTAPPPRMPFDLVGAPEQAVGADQHEPILAQTMRPTPSSFVSEKGWRPTATEGAADEGETSEVALNPQPSVAWSS